MPSSNPICPFCLEDVGDNVFVLHKSYLIEHVGCKSCIKEWLESFSSQFLCNERPTCPICREDVDEILSNNNFALCSVCRSYVPRFFVDAEKSICGDCEQVVEVLSY